MAERTPHRPVLLGPPGFDHAQLLLEQARARHRRTRGDPTGARGDLEAAECLATLSGMRTSLAECALLAGQLDSDLALGQSAMADRLARGAMADRFGGIPPTAPPRFPARSWTPEGVLCRVTARGDTAPRRDTIRARLTPDGGTDPTYPTAPSRLSEGTGHRP